jgi:hypothetical protein
VSIQLLNFHQRNHPLNKQKQVRKSSRKLDCSVYYNNRTEKLLKLEPKKIQNSDENLRAELTPILLTRQHDAFFLD